jgi:hypothetical protein
MKQLLFILVIISSIFSVSNAQNIFKGGIVLGANASQINGDKSYGYNKIGIQGGIQVSYETSELRYFSTGIFYSQRGALTKKLEYKDQWSIKLDYIEVPFTYNIKDWLVEDKGFYRVHAGLGLAYGRLFNPKASDFSAWVGREEFFRKNNLGWVAETTFFVNKNLGFGTRYTRDIIRIFQQNDNVSSGPLIGHFITLKTLYIF